MIVEQQLFLFASLDFPGRATLSVDEVAEKLGVTTRQVLDLIDEQELCAVNLASKGATRRWCKIPIEGYRAFILQRLTGPLRVDFLRTLPKNTLRDLQREIRDMLAA